MNFEFIVKENGNAVITKVNEPESFIIFPAEIEGHVVEELGENIIPPGTKSVVQNIILPQSVKKLGAHCFDDLHYLKTLILNEGLEEIGERAIYTCPDLVEIYIPETVENFGECAVGFTYEHGRSYKQRYFTLVCDKGSAAEKFCKDREINYKTKIIMD